MPIPRNKIDNDNNKDSVLGTLSRVLTFPINVHIAMARIIAANI